VLTNYHISREVELNGDDIINYYNEIKETLVKNEIYKKAKDYSKTRSDLNHYFEVRRLLVERQEPNMKIN